VKIEVKHLVNKEAAGGGGKGGGGSPLSRGAAMGHCCLLSWVTARYGIGE